MTIHEFGKDNKKIIVLLHPSAVMWDYFEYVIPLMEDKYHLIVPALPGYDEDQCGDFTSVEEIAGELANWLIDHGYKEIDCIYGCSMGGAIVARFISDDRVKAKSAVMDGGITPYQLPWLATRFIAIRDFLLIYAGKLGGAKLLEKAFSADDYSDEDLKYVEKVLDFMSPKTIWRTFESCNNYKMPEEIETSCGNIEYWYADMEEKDRKWDIEYIRDKFPQASFHVFEETGHGGLAALKPDLLATELERAIKGEEKIKK
ncbi:MAG: alpha/beta hydrolase [Mogibacterium sp.]|nr:alpha/beta hydrolase [Mogibacterium sp.]MBP3898745.1 alpha/beta hydrolase [Mogibacterium sp.]